MITEKKCPRCGETKPAECFDKSKQHSSGLYPYCKPCRSAWHQEWRAKNPEKYAEARRRSKRAQLEYRKAHGINYSDASRLRRYGVTPEQFVGMLESQGGRCAICGDAQEVTRTKKRALLDVDHCHRTGSVRGLLCSACNRGLGCFRDDVIRMRAAIEYLLNSATYQHDKVAELPDVDDEDEDAA